MRAFLFPQHQEYEATKDNLLVIRNTQPIMTRGDTQYQSLREEEIRKS